MKKNLLIAYCVACYGLPLPFSFSDFDALAQGFDYQPTENQSMSKYQRIGNIENYLKNLQSNLSKMQASMDQKYTTGDSNILLKIKALESSINVIKLEVDALKKSTSTQKEALSAKEKESSPSSTQLSAQVQENAAKIEALQASFLSLENTLKSIQEMVQTKNELK